MRDEKLKAKEEELNKSSFVQISGEGVIARVSGQFVNSLYKTPEGNCGKVVVAFNTLTGAITVSLAEPLDGVSCRDIVQRLWGKDAGGHDGIAGSPRGQHMTLDDFARAFAFVNDYLEFKEVES